MMRKCLLSAVSFLVLFFGFFRPALADENPESMLTVKVDHVAGITEKIGEKISLFLRFNTKSKTQYYENLLEKRLAELAYVIDSKKFDDIEIVASRYSTYLGVLSNYVAKNKVEEEKGNVLSIFERHEKVIPLMQKAFEYNSGWWLVLQHDINSLKIFKDKLTSL